MSASRAKNIGKNSLISILSQLLIIVAGFFSQRVINVKLGTELVGLNGVISNVIAVFSVSELGLSTAIVFHLYRALAQAREEKIAALMNLYRRAYLVVAGVITLLGLAFLPFFHLFTKENHFALSYVRLIYVLWLVKTVLGYLLSYKRSILIADQREYVSSLLAMTATILQYFSIIVIILLGGKYEWALSLSIFFDVIMNCVMIAYVNQTYPYLRRSHGRLEDKGLAQSIFIDVKNLFATRIAQKLLGSTDNLILSSFINLSIVGFYSNYFLITQSLINVMQALSGALQPTIGNLIVEEDRDRDQELLQAFTFVFFFLAAIITCGVAGLASIFVGDIWLGEEFLLPIPTVFFLSVNCMLYIMSLPVGAFISASGLFQFEKKIALSAAIVNLLLSLVLVQPLGLPGVLTGTLAAYLILIIGKSVGFCRLYLQKACGGYLMQLLEYGALSVAEGATCVYLTGKLCGTFTLFGFLGALVVCVIFPCGINGLLFYRSKRTKSLLVLVKKYVRNVKKTPK
ncbi:MAG: hypothetical protein IJU80_13425 [Lachnospiraceae bacterium]|nr:hypothetical protein [Lachnospiraceae bacterium]